jgi:hypothetical protein
MEMVCVNSSNVVSIGHENNKLYVEYRRGEYVYNNVPKKVYDELLKAESKGKYLCANVKGKYDYERIA